MTKAFGKKTVELKVNLLNKNMWQVIFLDWN